MKADREGMGSKQYTDGEGYCLVQINIVLGI